MSSSKPFWSTHLKTSSARENVDFCAGRDVCSRPMADACLLPFDIWTNQVSVIALTRAGVLNREEQRSLLTALKQIAADFRSGQLILNPAFEDVHMNIEVLLEGIIGQELAGKIHTGRSRNDQSATDLRLYMREAALDFQRELIALSALLCDLADQYKGTVCPGFSHGQPAMVTTFGHILLNYLEALARDIDRLGYFFGQVNHSPLGAAAGFGTSWPLDRKLMADLLGFATVMENSLDAVSSRWELESFLAFIIVTSMNHLSQMANDLYFWSHPYIDFVTIDESLVTGSSIMPQKKNPDILEVLRAKTTQAGGYLHTLSGLGGKNLSGYNRDYQWAKYSLIDLIDECQDAPSIMGKVFKTLTVKAGNMKARAGENFLNAVEIADILAKNRQISFREGYRLTGLMVKECVENNLTTFDLNIINKILTEQKIAELTPDEEKLLGDPLSIINNRSTIGAASLPAIAESLAARRDRHQKHRDEHQQNRQQVDVARQKTDNYQAR